MYQNVVMWNLSRQEEDVEQLIKNITYRGYNKEKYLTSPFANKIRSEEVKPLAVRNIADKYCPTRRDVYYEKGRNQKYRRKGSKKWGRIAGMLSQIYLASLFMQSLKDEDIENYCDATKKINDYSSSFKKDKEEKIQELVKLAAKEYENPDRLLKTLEASGEMEIGAKALHRVLCSDGEYMHPEDILIEHEGIKIEISPNPVEIGVNISTPDFLIEKFRIIGDIKTGVKFEDRYLLTCAGYALAYENWKKNNNERDINWGIIYFLPTRILTTFAKPITTPQLYIFLIEDNLRGWFLKERDDTYNIIGKDIPPDFPENIKKCVGCKYEKQCRELGLKL